MKQKLCHWLAGTILFLALGTANATLITAGLVQLTGDRWQATYSVTNNTLLSAIDEFSISFALGLFEDIDDTATPIDWDPLIFQPDPSLPDDGIYDALALNVGIAPGDTLGGFVVEFDFLGSGIPPGQIFEIFDPFNFDVLGSGMSVITSVTTLPVPVPATLWLFMVGLLAFTADKKNKKLDI